VVSCRLDFQYEDCKRHPSKFSALLRCVLYLVLGRVPDEGRIDATGNGRFTRFGRIRRRCDCCLARRFRTTTSLGNISRGAVRIFRRLRISMGATTVIWRQIGTATRTGDYGDFLSRGSCVCASSDTLSANCQLLICRLTGEVATSTQL
jgi:hypothetical protein